MNADEVYAQLEELRREILTFAHKLETQRGSVYSVESEPDEARLARLREQEAELAKQLAGTA
jgi:hypothetical protein